MQIKMIFCLWNSTEKFFDKDTSRVYNTTTLSIRHLSRALWKKPNSLQGIETNSAKSGKVPACPTRCKFVDWWHDFQIHEKLNNRRVFIGIGIPETTPSKIYESPLLEAKRYQKLLLEPHIETQADIAKELRITRARVCQIVGLLRLAPEIQEELLGFQDQQAIQYFTERRLRPLLQIKDRYQQIEKFRQIVQIYHQQHSTSPL